MIIIFSWRVFSYIQKVYPLNEKNGFRLLWTNPQNIDELFAAIKTIDEDGLHPEDYHFTKIEKMRSQKIPV